MSDLWKPYKDLEKGLSTFIGECRLAGLIDTPRQSYLTTNDMGMYFQVGDEEMHVYWRPIGKKWLLHRKGVVEGYRWTILGGHHCKTLEEVEDYLRDWIHKND